MNDRIEQLAQEAAHSTRMTHNNAYWRMMDEVPEDKAWREKFAELIVRECAEVTLRDYDDTQDFSGNPYMDMQGAYRAGKLDSTFAIKEHFGVE